MRKALLEVLHSLMFTYYWPGLSHVYHSFLEKQVHWVLFLLSTRVFIGRTDAEAETPVLWPPYAKSWLIGKDFDAGRDWGQEEKGMT